MTCHKKFRRSSGELPDGSISEKEIDEMIGPWSPDMWGSPIGLGIFLFLMGSGMGVFFWGVSKISKKQ